MIPLDLLNQKPMLATPSNQPPEQLLAAGPGFTYDIKWDGIRALVYIDEDRICLRGRNGTDMTRRYPELVERLREQFPTGSYVFDGELINFDPATGIPSFNRAQKRDKQAKEAAIADCAQRMPATFVAFDFLWNGDDLRHVPLAARQALLALNARSWGNDRRLMATQASDDGAALWAFTEQFGLEGLILKRKDSIYAGRRDSAWVKIKRTKRLTAIVTGYENGEGSRDGKIGALLVSLLDDAGTLVPVGKVGTGLKESDHAPLLACLHRGEQFLIEVEFLGFHNQLRMPVYKGLRSDITRAECTLAQIGT